MNIQEKSKVEYLSRINKVMDYIDEHIDQPLLVSARKGEC